MTTPTQDPTGSDHAGALEPAAEPASPPAPDPGGAHDERSSGIGRAILNVWTADSSALVTVLAIVLAFVFGAILMVLSDTTDAMPKSTYLLSSPGDFLSAAWHDIATGYTALFKGAIIDPAMIQGTPAQAFGPITQTLEFAAPLIFGGLAISVAFRAGLFNIGGQGQIIVGAIFASYVAFAWTALPGVPHLIVAILAGVVGGVLYGGLVGWLKAKRGAHEVIVTIMLNYVALLAIGGWLLNTTAFHDPKRMGQAISKPAPGDARLPHLFGSSLNTDIGLLLALAAVFGVSWFLNRSKLGFEVRAVGLNPRAARTAGMNVAKSQIAAMIVSGGLMGLVGVIQVLGTVNANNNSLAPDIDNGLGFSAITVALLGRTKPLGVVWAALLFGAIQSGGAVMQTQANVSKEIIMVLQALIVLFVAAPGLVKEIFRLRSGRRAQATESLAAAATAGGQA
jgi:general nucleoside transport system permease protein